MVLYGVMYGRMPVSFSVVSDTVRSMNRSVSLNMGRSEDEFSRSFNSMSICVEPSSKYVSSVCKTVHLCPSASKAGFSVAAKKPVSRSWSMVIFMRNASVVPLFVGCIGLLAFEFVGL